MLKKEFSENELQIIGPDTGRWVGSLQRKYADLGEYPVSAFGIESWRQAVLAGETFMSYWDWVQESLTELRDDGVRTIKVSLEEDLYPYPLEGGAGQFLGLGGDADRRFIELCKKRGITGFSFSYHHYETSELAERLKGACKEGRLSGLEHGIDFESWEILRDGRRLSFDDCELPTPALKVYANDDYWRLIVQFRFWPDGGMAELRICPPDEESRIALERYLTKARSVYAHGPCFWTWTMQTECEQLTRGTNLGNSTRKLTIPLDWPHPPAEPGGRVLVGDLMGSADALFVEECKRLGITELSFLVDTVALNIRGLAMREFVNENNLDEVRNSVEYRDYCAVGGIAALEESDRPVLLLTIEASGGGWMLMARLALNGGTAFVQFPHWDFK